MMSLVDRLGGARAPGEHVGDRRLDVGSAGRSSRTGCPAGRGRPPACAARCGAARRSSVRTVVVLPVPPFWESTAIVWAIGAILRAARRRAAPRSARISRRRLDAAEPAAELAPSTRRLTGTLRKLQPVAPDDDLVAVLQRLARRRARR